MARHNSRLFESFSNGYYNGGYTEEEQRGVDKYLWRRFVGGVSVMCAMILLVLTGYACNCVSQSCTRAEVGGTWVLEEDYGDGFDSDDRFIDFRYEENRFGDMKLRLYMDGDLKGEVSRRDGCLAVKAERTTGLPGTSYGYSQDRVIWITAENDEITLKYKEYSYVLKPEYMDSEVISSFAYIENVTDVTEIYVRISTDVNLSDEQRNSLY